MRNNWNVFYLVVGIFKVYTSEKLERIKQTNEFDILGIVETRKSVKESVNIEGYKVFKACREKLERICVGERKNVCFS